MIKDFQMLIDKLEIWGAEPKQVLEETFMDDENFYLSCLENFSKEPFLQTMREALVPEQKELAIRTVHTMKGNADYLGLFPILDAAMIVLNDLRADNLEQAVADFSQLEAIFTDYINLISEPT